MRGRLPDPSWKSGPTYPEPTSSEHAISPEDFGHAPADWDGFGVDEAESVEGEPLVVLQESAECARDGCDAAHKRRLLFTTHTLSDDEERRLRQHVRLSTDSELGVHVHENAERVDIETIEVNGISITAERIIEDEAVGSCYGHVEPDPEPQWRDI